ncbi:MAG: pseudouridine synthase [Bacteroidota bacterium]|nr:pseudouridine synthase [Bacteroidota bacterium]
MPQYFIVYKPYQVLTQFSSTENKVTLKDFFEVSKDVYPVGRLDYDSEGLLILTNDTSLNHRLLHPSFKHEREYWAQVDGMPSTHVLQQLMKGVDITVDGKKYRTKHCIASLFDHAPIVPERNPPIRFRKEIPAPWIRLILQEGKNRQVRKMTAAIGHPTLRLIRYRIEDITLEQLQPGEMKELSQKVIYKKLFHE